MKRLAVCITALLFVVGCGKKNLKTDKEKYSYAIGYQFTKNLKTQNVDIDANAFKAAVDEVLKDKKELSMTEEDMQKAMQKMYEVRQGQMSQEADANKKKGLEYLEKNKAAEGIKTTETGLQYKVQSEGSGATPKDDDTVVVHYKGTLIDGTEFDSSYKRNQPAEFPVKAVIPGWTEALKKMKKGSKWNLYIPPELAYGDRGRPGIPANSVLVFDVELIDIKAAGAKAKK